MTPVFLTVDTEIAWRHHAAGLEMPTLFERSIEPAGVGIGYQLRQLARYGLKACFFVDPMPALLFGLEPFRRLIGTIREAGQEVQLHLHPNWTGARADDQGRSHARFEMVEYTEEDQEALISGARDLLVAAGAEAPVAYRSGSYAANDATLRALHRLGLKYDSSHNGAEHPWPSLIDLPVRQIAPVARHGVIEVPVTVIEDRPGSLRNFQICALSSGEMQAALEHAAEQDHAAVTIVSHSFELANRSGTRPNSVHVRRFEALCTMLAERMGSMPTMHFADADLRLDSPDVPLGPSPLRSSWRQAEQLWSNVIEERAA
ncbi:polysaccharide deacetylase [Sphingomonas sp. Leaf357]|uniref:polysaccharide deacetylase family protein n=1 Tax=Sphingomonas sp. Leaf357 TaxID=1736350 RepID=UPI0006F2FBCF|nr:polysaccharide deacetylase [Sphingomonas sp. Leaf357]KQS05236.1 polysaccharide deacetylase [Sphingomonas sp. Leaf357]